MIASDIARQSAIKATEGLNEVMLSTLLEPVVKKFRIPTGTIEDIGKPFAFK